MGIILCALGFKSLCPDRSEEDSPVSYSASYSADSYFSRSIDVGDMFMGWESREAEHARTLARKIEDGDDVAQHLNDPVMQKIFRKGDDTDKRDIVKLGADAAEAGRVTPGDIENRKLKEQVQFELSKRKAASRSRRRGSLADLRASLGNKATTKQEAIDTAKNPDLDNLYNQAGSEEKNEIVDNLAATLARHNLPSNLIRNILIRKQVEQARFRRSLAAVPGEERQALEELDGLTPDRFMAALNNPRISQLVAGTLKREQEENKRTGAVNVIGRWVRRKFRDQKQIEKIENVDLRASVYAASLKAGVDVPGSRRGASGRQSAHGDQDAANGRSPSGSQSAHGDQAATNGRGASRRQSATGDQAANGRGASGRQSATGAFRRQSTTGDQAANGRGASGRQSGPGDQDDSDDQDDSGDQDAPGGQGAPRSVRFGNAPSFVSRAASRASVRAGAGAGTGADRQQSLNVAAEEFVEEVGSKVADQIAENVDEVVQNNPDVKRVLGQEGIPVDDPVKVYLAAHVRRPEYMSPDVQAKYEECMAQAEAVKEVTDVLKGLVAELNALMEEHNHFPGEFAYLAQKIDAAAGPNVNALSKAESEIVRACEKVSEALDNAVDDGNKQATPNRHDKCDKPLEDVRQAYANGEPYDDIVRKIEVYWNGCTRTDAEKRDEIRGIAKELLERAYIEVLKGHEHSDAEYMRDWENLGTWLVNLGFPDPHKHSRVNEEGRNTVRRRQLSLKRYREYEFNKNFLAEVERYETYLQQLVVEHNAIKIDGNDDEADNLDGFQARKRIRNQYNLVYNQYYELIKGAPITDGDAYVSTDTIRMAEFLRRKEEERREAEEQARREKEEALRLIQEENERKVREQQLAALLDKEQADMRAKLEEANRIRQQQLKAEHARLAREYAANLKKNQENEERRMGIQIANEARERAIRKAKEEQLEQARLLEEAKKAEQEARNAEEAAAAKERAREAEEEQRKQIRIREDIEKRKKRMDNDEIEGQKVLKANRVVHGNWGNIQRDDKQEDAVYAKLSVVKAARAEQDVRAGKEKFGSDKSCSFSYPLCPENSQATQFIDSRASYTVVRAHQNVAWREWDTFKALAVQIIVKDKLHEKLKMVETTGFFSQEQRVSDENIERLSSLLTLTYSTFAEDGVDRKRVARVIQVIPGYFSLAVAEPANVRKIDEGLSTYAQQYHIVPPFDDTSAGAFRWIYDKVWVKDPAKFARSLTSVRMTPLEEDTLGRVGQKALAFLRKLTEREDLLRVLNLPDRDTCRRRLKIALTRIAIRKSTGKRNARDQCPGTDFDRLMNMLNDNLAELLQPIEEATNVLVTPWTFCAGLADPEREKNVSLDASYLLTGRDHAFDLYLQYINLISTYTLERMLNGVPMSRARKEYRSSLLDDKRLFPDPRQKLPPQPYRPPSPPNEKAVRGRAPGVYGMLPEDYYRSLSGRQE